MGRDRTGPLRPSAETEALTRFLREEAAKYPDLKLDNLLRALAVALARRYPGLTAAADVGGLFAPEIGGEG